MIRGGRSVNHIVVFDRTKDDPGMAIDCGYQTGGHREFHHPHPITGKPVCHICHPPPGAEKPDAAG